VGVRDGHRCPCRSRAAKLRAARSELGNVQETMTGTPQGGIASPLLANIALAVLDEHLHGPWQPGGEMATVS
jgi:hypothetical protein